MIPLKSISNRIKISHDKQISLKCYYNEEPKQKDLETIIFLNSSLFNQNQWQRFITELNSRIRFKNKFQFITYDNAGIGESTYLSEVCTIDGFLKEFEIVMKWTESEKVHIFGISIGAWIGLNLSFLRPEWIKSFAGYGNLAPYHEAYQDLILELIKVEDCFDRFKTMIGNQVDSSNWMNVLEIFYIPLFFQDLFNSKKSFTDNSKIKEIITKLMFPIVKGNNIRFYKDIYQYLSKNIIKEGYTLLELIKTSHYKTPILFMNGKTDSIANPIMSIDLNKKINDSKLRLFNNLKHGSILLGKGFNEIIDEYMRFLDL